MKITKGVAIFIYSLGFISGLIFAILINL